MSKQIINTPKAPSAIGPYSQAVRVGDTVYTSGQIALDPASGLVVEGDIEAQAHRVFLNLKEVCEAAGGSLENIVRLGLFMTDLGDFNKVNAVMGEYFNPPYPARSTVQVSALPRGVNFEADAIMVLE
ncbi:MAG: RidA family protein [Lysobacter sp.]|nr:RidA family protein [Lysobacter sp.]